MSKKPFRHIFLRKHSPKDYFRLCRVSSEIFYNFQENGASGKTLIELKMWQSGHCDRAAHSQLKTRLSTKWPSFGALWTHVARVSTPWWIASFPNISFESIVTKSAARPRSWPNPRFRPWTFWGRNRLLFSGSNKTKKLFIPPLIIWVGWVKP